VAGLPWFGVQIGIFQKQKPVAAAMFLPIEKTFYFARAGRGVFKNGKTVRVTRETKLRNVLCAFGFDAAAEDRRRRKMISLLMRVSGGVRNTRATNSLVDFCHTLEGRFGGCINLNCKIWDIVPVAVMLPEAGGRLTDIGGKPLRFDLGETSCERVYAILGASKALHPRLLALTRSATLKA
jgi:myo-inositol-1(or 4)-monophosphatase